MAIFCSENRGRNRKRKLIRILTIWIHKTVFFVYIYNIIDIENLKIPHPHIQKRRFILVPLSEILPQIQHPLLKKTNQELLDMVKDEGNVDSS